MQFASGVFESVEKHGISNSLSIETTLSGAKVPINETFSPTGIKSQAHVLTFYENCVHCNFLFEGNTISFGKRDLRECFASGCGAFSRQYLMYCEKTEQNPGVKFPYSAADAIVRYCLKFYRRTAAV